MTPSRVERFADSAVLKRGELPKGHKLVKRGLWRLRNPKGLRKPRKAKR